MLWPLVCQQIHLRVLICMSHKERLHQKTPAGFQWPGLEQNKSSPSFRSYPFLVSPPAYAALFIYEVRVDACVAEALGPVWFGCGD